MKRVPMAQFGRVKGKRHIVIGTEKSGSVFGNVEKSTTDTKATNEWQKRQTSKVVERWEVKTHLVSRLVATAFIPNLENKPTINHIDGNPLNNNIVNLEWATYKENNSHAFKTGLMSTETKKLS